MQPKTDKDIVQEVRTRRAEHIQQETKADNMDCFIFNLGQQWSWFWLAILALIGEKRRRSGQRVALYIRRRDRVSASPARNDC
jgi:hypothetical protein